MKAYLTNTLRALGLGALLAVAGPGHAQLDTQETLVFLHTDALGSALLETDINGDPLREVDYRAYGEEVLNSAQTGPGYTGHYRDASSGLVYMQQRYYDPGTGMFLSVDPVTADPNNGALFNRYMYAANNPYRFIDPDGRCTGSRITTGDGMCRSTGGITTLASTANSVGPFDNRTYGMQNPRSWPVRGHRNLNEADKPREGKGEFGSPRNTARGPSTHTGIDIEAPAGSDVLAMADGAVVKITPNPSGTYGIQVVIDHGNGVFSQSAHLEAALVKPGARVNGGQIIGTVGRTGNTPALGDLHLHFEVRLNSSAPRVAGGVVTDPMPYVPEP